MKTRRAHGWAVASLWASVFVCAIAHLVLRDSASGVDGVGAMVTRPGIILGLMIYALGTLLWILCLRKLDLSYAYPASALQLVIVYFGSAIFLGESIPLTRWIGVGVIIAGIILLSTSGRRDSA